MNGQRQETAATKQKYEQYSNHDLSALYEVDAVVVSSL